MAYCENLEGAERVYVQTAEEHHGYMGDVEVLLQLLEEHEDVSEADQHDYLI